MKFKPMFWLIGILLSVFLILQGLLARTKLLNSDKNGFTRIYKKNEAPSLIAKKILSKEISRICGISNSSIFLAGTNPKAILILNKNLVDEDTIFIEMPFTPDKIVPNTLVVDTPMLYLHLNNLKTIIYGRFPSDKMNLRKLNKELTIFSKSVQISPSTIITRSFSQQRQTQIFSKINIETGEIIKEGQIIETEYQDPWGLQSDGMLTYDKSSKRLIYLQYFTNNFTCFDTNLNVLYKSHTIDTNYVSKIKVGKEFDRDGKVKITPSEARFTVNDFSFSGNNFLFVVSALCADNETLKEFNQTDVIDIYSIQNGKYICSFHIPRVERKSLESAYIDNYTLLVLTNSEIHF
jgi:hypothetical protein